MKYYFIDDDDLSKLYNLSNDQNFIMNKILNFPKFTLLSENLFLYSLSPQGYYKRILTSLEEKKLIKFIDIDSEIVEKLYKLRILK